MHRRATMYTLNEKFGTIIAICTVISLLVAVICAPVSAEEREYKIAIVKSWDLPEYNVALEGFSETISRQKIPCAIVTYNLKGKVDGAGEVIEDLRAYNPDLILTVGSRATSVISKNFEDTSIVFAMVLYPVASDFVQNINTPAKNLTGAAIDVPIKRQLKALSEIVPNLKRVGVLYSPDETLPVIEEASRVAASLNLTLLAEQVDSESDVPDALSKLDKQKMDALWSVADGKVFTRPSIKYIIEYVVRRGIPFMAPHNGFVKAGALVALTADYRDNGRQAGEISIEILRGKKPENISVATPRTVSMALNLQVANHIRLKIPRNIVEGASQVIE